MGSSPVRSGMSPCSGSLRGEGSAHPLAEDEGVWFGHRRGEGEAVVFLRSNSKPVAGGRAASPPSSSCRENQIPLAVGGQRVAKPVLGHLLLGR